MWVVLFLFLVSNAVTSNPAETLTASLQKLVSDRQFAGLSIEISYNSNTTLYKGNFGLRDIERGLPINNSTYFRIASLSKSITAAGLMLLVEQGKLRLTDSISDVLGFNANNPNFPTTKITVQMVLSHQSSLVQCSAYNTFLDDSYNAATGAQVPNLALMWTKGSKYYNTCTFSSTHAPGTYFMYTNLNYVIAGTIIQKLAGQRFDLYMRQHYLSKFGDSDYNPANIPNPDDIAVLYRGTSGKWTATCDNYKGGAVPQKNMTGYVIGTNAAVYGPQGSVRSSVSDLIKHINIVREKGVYRDQQVLQATSTEEMIRPRYQYKGTKYGEQKDFHAYGAGIFKTTYHKYDTIWPNQCVVGHIGDAYGLISAYYYNGPYAVAYAVNGALNGYRFTTDSIYQQQRQIIDNLVYIFLFSGNQA